MKENVIYVTFSKDIDAKKIAELFNVYGDINVSLSIPLIFIRLLKALTMHAT